MNQIYQIPDEYFCRLHHVRPRFKSNVEEVLLYVANSISDLNTLPEKEFNEQLNAVLRNFGKNQTVKQKTINNWRTEIAALFSFIQETETGKLFPSLMAKRLAENQYLDEFFNYFLYTFQYPAGHNKNHAVIEQIQKGIQFQPCKFILQIFQAACELSDKPFSLTAEELTQCAYFDLRVTAEHSKTAHDVAKHIIENRENKIKYSHKYEQLKKENGDYPSAGDVYRYAGDILDYMVLANLLKTKGTQYYYYLNTDNPDLINRHLQNTAYFNQYDCFYHQEEISNAEIRALERQWFDYVNQFDNIAEFSPSLNQAEQADIAVLVQEYYAKMQGKELLPAKIFGDYGETLILAHEYLRTKGQSNRQHLINKIPTPLGVGYDLQSIEIEKHKRYIEVKSTRSKKAINSNRFKLTPNEWDSAETLGDSYFIYYLVMNETGKNIFIIQNPAKKYRENLLKIDSHFMVEFLPQAGKWQPLLEVSCSE
ncbi:MULTISPECIES: protein NO VEIN domain-containing protein [Neisseria]|uniref:protein NO VEIN domain-containing protein n=1 Tax=Neisseria polysaccharea TaxID=489 RepID=UPI0027DFF990|nr:DUF3883 domain-containing protein [Neisseria polysaccharea]